MAVILLVDETAADRDSIRSMLQFSGCEVREASSIAEAVAAIHDQAPDLLITDLFLPDRHGLLFIRQTNSQFPAMTIIALDKQTETDARDYRRLAMDCGAALVLTKPVSQIELTTAITDFLGPP